jgi:transposase
LSNRHYKCPCCELSLDRDENAALNILSLGLQAVGHDYKSCSKKPLGNSLGSNHEEG